MAQPPDLSREALQTDTRSLALARWLSQALNPFVSGVACYLIISLFAPIDLFAGLGWAALALAIQLTPSIALYTIRRRQGIYSDADVSVREERNEIYVVGSISVLIAIAVLIAAGAPAPYLAMTIGIFGLGIICGIINLIWKISMHSSAIASLATVALIYSAILGIVFWICALAVGWARIRTRNHTPLQVLGGLTVAAVVMTISFSLVGTA
ncbi:MAG TPA: phosphatase PAP2 family protein [Roseiflexaceae bacterium]|nr:phosphatase PAP2 family protein [Roseiflexaceae bacterium]HMP38896.1 phosphatase PAP2 family protein [Roseiflexaceae bacterium]